MANRDRALDALLAPRGTALLTNGNELPYPCLKEVVRRAGITPNDSWGEIQAKLQPLAPGLVLGRDDSGESALDDK